MDETDFESLALQVRQWARERGILPQGAPLAQLAKTLEELGELAGAIVRQRQEDIEDAIGDVLVTLIIQAEMQGLDPVECLSVAYARIAGRTGTLTAQGVFVKAGDDKVQ